MTLQLIARQSKAGAPISIGRILDEVSAEDDSAGTFLWYGLGVTTSSTVPGTFAAFAYFEGGDYSGSAYWDLILFQTNYAYVAGVAGPSRQRVTIRKSARIALDSHFVAGRYLWVVSSATKPPDGSTVPAQHSASYLIR